ncbi:unnamed protein product [Calypogeia fissa]
MIFLSRINEPDSQPKPTQTPPSMSWHLGTGRTKDEAPFLSFKELKDKEEANTKGSTEGRANSPCHLS